ncbi:MAG TPA: ABC transporter permease [Bdellovibrionales bacterium]|nr:ABC transporter permease [Bdellovibrionales bacterium]
MRESFELCWHITRRNWAVYKKDFLANISPTIADPALIMVSLGLGLGAYLTDVEGHSYMGFMAPGLTVSTALFTSFFESSYGFYVRMTFENVFKAMLTTPIGVREIVLGEFIWVGLKGGLMAVGVSIVLALFGLMSDPWLLPLMLFVGVLVALPCGAMGLLATSYVRNINQFQTVYSFLIAPLYFFSGIFFPISQMPQVVRIIGYLFPLVPGVALAQSVFWSRDIAASFAFNGTILTLQSLIFCAFALYRIRKKLEA